MTRKALKEALDLFEKAHGQTLRSSLHNPSLFRTRLAHKLGLMDLTEYERDGRRLCDTYDLHQIELAANGDACHTTGHIDGGKE